jgi:Holliday junction DNA helicase RuvB
MKKVKETNLNKEEISFEDSIRPQIFDHFVGQSEVKESLSLYIEAALKRGTTLDNVLFYGPPGLGKTTLAKIVANELGSNFHVTSGSVIEKPSDLIHSLVSLKDGDVLFIDEIHRLPKIVEEFLYPALEDKTIDIIVDSGKKDKVIERVKLAKFTVVAATTMAGMISAPLRDRFGIDYRLDFYSFSDLKFIAKRTAKVLHIEIEDIAAQLISHCARGTPRIVNRLLRRCQDYAEVKCNGVITSKVVNSTLKMLHIYNNGLNNMDISILKTIINVYNGGPVGINSLSATVNEDKETIETVNEPFLIQQGYIERTFRGRAITNKGKKLIGGLK